MKSIMRIKDFTKRLGNIHYVNLHSEFTLSILVFVFIFLTFASQIFVKTSFLKTLSVNTIESEGIDLEVYQQEMTNGTMTVKLEGLDDCSKADLIINGDVYSAFTQDTMTFYVRNNCLVEIDGTKANRPFTATIVSVSDNVITQNESPTVKVQKNIQFLSRVFLKS